MMTKPQHRVRVAADYHCWPTWVDNGTVFENADPRTLPISAQIAAALLQWAEEYDATLDQDYPPDSSFATPGDEAQWVERGRALAQRLTKELGGSAQVTYFDAGLSRDVEVAP
jgi:hypothetical protein